MAAIRRAQVTWAGDLFGGSGMIEGTTSGAVAGLPVTWASRVEAADGRTSPEELIAAAHASCFSMALSAGLARNGTPAERLAVSAAVTIDQTAAGWTVTSSALTVRGRVPGVDAARFAELAEAAKDGCPVSRALKGGVALSVEAALEA
jgi:osmotically inducible protein OsmC